MKSFIKIIYTLLLALFTSLFLFGCVSTKGADITTTLFPQYDIARYIAGDKLSVSLLTPIGTEVHGYEPSSIDIIDIKASKLFIYTSDQMERWAKDVISKTTNAINLKNHYTLTPYVDATATDDLHYWTDPDTVLQLVLFIRDEIIKIDPQNQDYYEQNAAAYYNDLNAIHVELLNYFENKRGANVFFYGHNALAPFANRYQLKINSLSDYYKPDQELTPGQKTDLKQKIKDANASYLFIEELIDLKAVDTFKDDLARDGYSLEILELHGFHNISKDQMQKGVTYIDLLKQNYENLQKAIA